MSSDIAIAILTYRRPAQLAACVSLVAEHVLTTSSVTIIVVDNDPAASARSVVAELASNSSIDVRYVAEPRPGIAAARNRAVREAEGMDVLVFIDDDETPTATWLHPLLETWQQTGAAAVMGRVVSVFDEPLEPWVAAGDFFRRRSMATGTEIAVGAAGNLLLDLVQVARLGIHFDERLGLAAGEDSLFTADLVRAGGRLVWCEESVTLDHVPAERATRRWVLDRAESHGNTEIVVALLGAGSESRRRGIRARALARGVARVVVGSLRNGLGLLSGSLRHQARGLRTAYRGRGMLAAARGIVVHEYARGRDHVNA